MAYGIIRVRNLHQADLKSTEKHNFRQYTDTDRPENITAGGYFSSYFTNDTDSLEEAIQKRFDEAKVKQRTDSVVALEYVLSLSPEAMEQITSEKGYNYSETAILQQLGIFIEQKHGRDNIVAISMHLDESNPHLHAIVTPISEKEVKWKNTRGEGVRKENRLCARDFTGDKDKLRQLQTDYFNHVSKLSDRFPKIRFERGVDARDRKARKEYYQKMTNHVLGGTLKELRELKQMILDGQVSKEAANDKINALETQIKAVYGNVEKKAGKDLEKYKKAEKWAKNTKDLDL